MLREYFTYDCVQVLETKETLVGQSELFDEENDEDEEESSNEDDSNMEILSGEDSSSEMEITGKSEEDTAGESDSEEDEETQKLNAALAEALGTSLSDANMPDADNDSDESMDDDQMM